MLSFFFKRMNLNGRSTLLAVPCPLIFLVSNTYYHDCFQTLFHVSKISFSGFAICTRSLQLLDVSVLACFTYEVRWMLTRTIRMKTNWFFITCESYESLFKWQEMITSSFEHDSHKVRHHKFRGPVLFYFMFLCVWTYMHCHIYPNHFHFHNFPKM